MQLTGVWLLWQLLSLLELGPLDPDLTWSPEHREIFHALNSAHCTQIHLQLHLQKACLSCITEDHG